jgi:AraC family transcriptional regulator
LLRSHASVNSSSIHCLTAGGSAETGIRFRPYVLWLRLEIAVASYAAGNSLTEASYAGGFADSAHFSRTFKRMFGVAAISVQRE